MARCCSSWPPLSTDTEPSSGSKRPLNIRLMRVSRATPTLGSEPPVLGTAWHSAQLFPLNTGPKPSSMVSTSSNSSSPSLKSPNCAGVRPGSGLVKFSSVLRVGPPLSQQQDQNACCREKYEPCLVYCPSHRFSFDASRL